MHRWANAVGRAALATLILVAAAPAAHGDWLESSSDHFVIYSDQDEKSVKGFSERLELFHAAMAFWFQRQQAKPSPSNRVSIFVVSSERQVREFAKTDNRYLAGIYLPRAGQSIALVPEVRRQGSKFDLSSETILYHEYAHHFMATLTSRTFPRWLVEGFAEFFASAHFHSDEVGLGRPATHRARELAFARTIPIRKLVDFDGGTSNGKQGFDAFYGQAWTLFHYLSSSPNEPGNLRSTRTCSRPATPRLKRPRVPLAISTSWRATSRPTSSVAGSATWGSRAGCCRSARSRFGR